MIFRHELIHWRRKDLWYKLLLLAARSIHWCNPLVWRMAKRAERDLEISCDSMAVQGRDAAYRKAYGLMILQEAERSIEKQAALTTCFTDGKRALQERLVEIMNQSKRKKRHGTGFCYACADIDLRLPHQLWEGRESIGVHAGYSSKAKVP